MVLLVFLFVLSWLRYAEWQFKRCSEKDAPAWIFIFWLILPFVIILQTIDIYYYFKG